MNRASSFVFAALVLLAAFPAAAQLKASGDQPVEISAAKSLEWNRSARTYTARGDALARQGAFQVQSATLTAHYNDKTGATDITQLVAQTGVVITSPPYKAYGDKAVYDVHADKATLTGGNLHVETATESLTAKDSLQYFGQEKKMTAIGSARAVRGDDTLTADRMDGFFTQDAQGKTQMTKITAQGNVVITTKKEKATGDSGVYDIPSQKAVLTGHVRILQGDSWLEGSRANVDMATGVSQLFADPTAATKAPDGTVTPASDGRVKGIFYPKSKGAAAAPNSAAAATVLPAATPISAPAPVVISGDAPQAPRSPVAQAPAGAEASSVPLQGAAAPNPPLQDAAADTQDAGAAPAQGIVLKPVPNPAQSGANTPPPALNQ